MYGRAGRLTGKNRRFLARAVLNVDAQPASAAAEQRLLEHYHAELCQLPALLA
jgi:hypothetical protein